MFWLSKISAFFKWLTSIVEINHYRLVMWRNLGSIKLFGLKKCDVLKGLITHLCLRSSFWVCVWICYWICVWMFPLEVYLSFCVMSLPLTKWFMPQTFHFHFIILCRNYIWYKLKKVKICSQMLEFDSWCGADQLSSCLLPTTQQADTYHCII